MSFVDATALRLIYATRIRQNDISFTQRITFNWSRIIYCIRIMLKQLRRWRSIWLNWMTTKGNGMNFPFPTESDSKCRNASQQWNHLVTGDGELLSNQPFNLSTPNTNYFTFLILYLYSPYIYVHLWTTIVWMDFPYPKNMSRKKSLTSIDRNASSNVNDWIVNWL